MLTIRQAVDSIGLPKSYIAGVIGITQSKMYHLYYNHYDTDEKTKAKILDYCADIKALNNKYKKY